jgi:DnaJ-class molecular chaperone
MITDYYAILGLPRTASSRQIRKQTLTLGTRYFPGRTELLDEPQTFISIVEAHEVLQNDKIRVICDVLLEHQEGKVALRDRALERHRRVMDLASRRGKEKGAYYAAKNLGTFKEDHRSVNWWNVGLTGLWELLENMLSG